LQGGGKRKGKGQKNREEFKTEPGQREPDSKKGPKKEVGKGKNPPLGKGRPLGGKKGKNQMMRDKRPKECNSWTGGSGNQRKSGHQEIERKGVKQGG